jgi:hypothetical protein
MTWHSSTIFDLNIRWRLVVRFTPRPCYPWGKESRHPLDRRLCGSQTRSGHCGVGNISCLCRESPSSILIDTPLYRVFIVQASQISQYVVSRGGIFLVQYTRCSFCRFIRLLSMWCCAVAFFSAGGAALSQEITMVKWMSNQPALWNLWALWALVPIIIIIKIIPKFRFHESSFIRTLVDKNVLNTDTDIISNHYSSHTVSLSYDDEICTAKETVWIMLSCEPSGISSLFIFMIVLWCTLRRRRKITIIHNKLKVKVKISLLQAMEAHRVARG